MNKINLGCGTSIKKGWINIDIIKRKGVNIVYDLEKTKTKRLPFRNNNIDYIYAEDILEHITEIIPLMSELCRILKPGKKMVIKVPYETGTTMWECPEHKRCFGYGTFLYFVKNKRIHTFNINKFSGIQRKIIFPRGLHIFGGFFECIFNKIPLIYDGTCLKYLFPAEALIITMYK